MNDIVNRWDCCPTLAPEKVGPFIPRLKDGGILGRFGELSPVLTASLHTLSHYVMGIRDECVIHFQHANLMPGKKWLQVFGLDAENEESTINAGGISLGFPRRIDVRISDIMWVADITERSERAERNTTL